MKSSHLTALSLSLILAGVAGHAADSAGKAPAAASPAPPAAPAVAAAHPLEGKWTAEFDSPVGQQTYKYEFKVEGGKVTGTAEGSLFAAKTAIEEGKVVGDEVTFVETADFNGTPLRITYKGKLKGDEIAFSRNVADFADEELVAKRAKPAAAAPAAPAAPAGAPAPAKK